VAPGTPRSQKTAQKQKCREKRVDNHPSEDYHNRNDSASAGGRILTMMMTQAATFFFSSLAMD